MKDGSIYIAGLKGQFCRRRKALPPLQEDDTECANTAGGITSPKDAEHGEVEDVRELDTPL